MWTFEIASGRLLDSNGAEIDVGYSGQPKYRNDPAATHLPKEGPLPAGLYRIGKPYDSQHVGPFALPLIAAKNNEMFGRSAFRIHGDNKFAPGTASQGCIILRRKTREIVAASGDGELCVVSGIKTSGGPASSSGLVATIDGESAGPPEQLKLL